MNNIQTESGRTDAMKRAEDQQKHRSASFQPAVSPISNRQTSPQLKRATKNTAPSQAGSLRYSRLETCATMLAAFSPIEKFSPNSAFKLNGCSLTIFSNHL